MIIQTDDLLRRQLPKYQIKFWEYSKAMALDRTSEAQAGQVSFAVKTTEMPLSSFLGFKLHTQKPNCLKKVQLPLVSAWKWGIQCNKWKWTQSQAGHQGTLKCSRLKSKTFQIPLPLAVCSYQMIARGQRQGLQLWILPRDPFGWQQQQQEVPKARLWAGPVPRRAGHPSGPAEWCAEGAGRSWALLKSIVRLKYKPVESEEAIS